MLAGVRALPWQQMEIHQLKIRQVEVGGFRCTWRALQFPIKTESIFNMEFD